MKRDDPAVLNVYSVIFSKKCLNFVIYDQVISMWHIVKEGF